MRAAPARICETPERTFAPSAGGGTEQSSLRGRCADAGARRAQEIRLLVEQHSAARERESAAAAASLQVRACPTHE
jgi:hypothetical protein